MSIVLKLILYFFSNWLSVEIKKKRMRTCKWRARVDISVIIFKPNLKMEYKIRRIPLPQSKRSIALDVGGVIIAHGGSSTQSLLNDEHYLTAKPVPGAIEGVTALVAILGPENVFICSKAKETISRRTLEWMETHDFFQTTGFNRENILFVRQKLDKAAACHHWGIKAFVDDTISVLKPAAKRNPGLHCLFFAPETKIKHTRELIIIVNNWDDVLNYVSNNL